MKVLEAAGAEWTIRGERHGDKHARVRIGDSVAEAHDTCAARAICLAVARAIGVMP